jgi:KDO2-lipid IV(A) lauroyltransferase
MSARLGLESLAVRAALGVAGRLPRPVGEACGTAAGRLFFLLDRRHRLVADANVAAVFPALSPAERRALVRRAFEHFGRLLFAVLEFSRLTPEAMRRRAEIVGAGHVRAAHAEGKGVLFVTGHFGCWEIQALVHALEFPPMAVLARPLDNPVLHDRLERIRTRTGNSVIYRQGSIRRVLRTLGSGQGVGILIDQHILGRDAVPVSFFGRPAKTTTAVAALALRTGAPVIPLFALPLGGGRYRLVYEPPVPPPADDHPDRIGEFTQRCSDVLERYVRERPDLWLWMHRRWRE